MQPAFHRERVEAYASAMVEAARRRAASWPAGAVLDMQAEMAGISIAVAGHTLFGSNIEDEAADIAAALTDALASFNFVLLPLGDRLARLPIPPAIRFRRARARLDATIYRLIAERRASGGERGSNALAWAWFLISGHEQVETQLHREADAVLDGRAATAADLPRLQYTRAVVAETMRLYPPAYLVGRKPGHPVVPDPIITLRAKHGIRMTAYNR